MQWLDTCIPEPNVTQYTDGLVCHHVSIRLIEGTRWRIILVCRQHFTVWSVEAIFYISRVSCQKGPTRHANAWQKGPFWQDTLDMFYTFECCQNILGDTLLLTRLAVDYWLLLLYVNAPCYYQHQPVKKVYNFNTTSCNDSTRCTFVISIHISLYTRADDTSHTKWLFQRTLIMPHFIETSSPVES